MATKVGHFEAFLPFDIIGSILDQLAYEEDMKTLCACSFMSRDILHLCRTHLFRTFDMRTKTASKEERTLIEFYYLLSVNPHLVRYVHIVHILDLNSKHWVLNHPFLPRLLQILTDVETFGLHIMKSASWNSIDSVLRASMMELADSPSLVELYLTGVKDVHLSFLNSCRFLKLLNLNSTSLESPSGRKEPDEEAEKSKSKSKSIGPVDEHHIYLEVVSFSNCQLFLARLSDYLDTSFLIFDFSHLRVININFTPTTFDLTWKIIHSARTTLETLKVSQSYTDESEFSVQTHSFLLSSRLDSQRQLLPHVTLAPMYQLRHLAFSIQIQDLFDPPPQESIGEWCLLLQTAPRGIKTIHITLDLFFLFFEGVNELFPCETTQKSNNSKSQREEKLTLLTKLDETLSSAQFFPALSNLTLEVQLPEDHEDSSDSEYAVYGDGDDNGDPHQPSLTFEEITSSVKRMMKLTRKRLRETAPSGTDAFSILVGIGG